MVEEEDEDELEPYERREMRENDDLDMVKVDLVADDVTAEEWADIQEAAFEVDTAVIDDTVMKGKWTIKNGKPTFKPWRFWPAKTAEDSSPRRRCDRVLSALRGEDPDDLPEGARRRRRDDGAASWGGRRYGVEECDISSEDGPLRRRPGSIRLVRLRAAFASRPPRAACRKTRPRLLHRGQRSPSATAAPASPGERLVGFGNARTIPRCYGQARVYTAQSHF